MADYPATRAAAMALGDEQRLVRQGYDFLDEKRMLLATEIMSQLGTWTRLQSALQDGMAQARAALAGALADHGLEELQVHPQRVADDEATVINRTGFLGVTLVNVELAAAGQASVEAGGGSAAQCGVAFQALLPLARQLAAISGNLLRLADEYRRTERRARALENVLLPEIAQALKTIEERLEAVDQEDAVRVRLSDRTSPSASPSGRH